MFAGSIIVADNKFLSHTSYSNTKYCYYEIPNDYELNGGEQPYLIKELEVFQIV